jgi:hypothetical protein
MKKIFFIFSFFLSIVAFCQSSSKSDTLVSTNDLLLIKSERFFNFLKQEEFVPFIDPDIFYFEGELRDSFAVPKSFLLLFFRKENRFTVFTGGELIYRGEGSWDNPNGKHIYETPWEKAEGTIVNGMPEGMVLFFNKKTGGELEKNYSQGKLDGVIRSVNQFGVIDYYSEFKEGERNGLTFASHENGMIEFYHYYENGKLQDGNHFQFDDTGEITQVTKVVEGEIVEIKYFFD